MFVPLFHKDSGSVFFISAMPMPGLQYPSSNTSGGPGYPTSGFPPYPSGSYPNPYPGYPQPNQNSGYPPYPPSSSNLSYPGSQPQRPPVYPGAGAGYPSGQFNSHPPYPISNSVGMQILIVCIFTMKPSAFVICCVTDHSCADISALFCLSLPALTQLISRTRFSPFNYSSLKQTVICYQGKGGGGGQAPLLMYFIY